MSRIAAVLAVLALLAAGCAGSNTGDGGGGNAPAAPVTPPEFAITVADQGVTELPEDVTAGIVTITIENEGKAKLFPAFARVNEGVKPEEVGVALSTGNFGKFFASAIPAGAVVTAGENNLLPGTSGSITTELTEGTYIVIDPEAKRFEPGYLEVGASTGEEVAEPEADATIDEGEYYIEVGELTAGVNRIALTNAGEQGHELIVFDKETEDEAGFAFAPTPGQTSWIELDLEPGTYQFRCFFPDVKDGKMGKKNHAQLGMKATVTVE